MKVIELFGGIGACTSGLKNIGLEVELIDYVEIDKYAVKSFNAINGTSFSVQDIRNWDKNFESIDLITHGSPCTDFSIAGKQKGGNKESGTRSSLMWETVRIIEKIKPKYILWENVKNVLSKAHIHNFESYLKELETLGYRSFYKVINAKEYLPQNRERLFCVSVRNDIKKEYEFPEKQQQELKLKDMLENEVDKKYYIKQEISDKLFLNLKDKEMNDCISGGKGNLDSKHAKCLCCVGMLDIKGNEQIRRVYADEGISPTLNTMQGGNRQPKILQENYIIRKLTPLECWRLMGFKDEQFYKAKSAGVSDSQLYKQAGNSICVPVLENIFKNLF